MHNFEIVFAMILSFEDGNNGRKGLLCDNKMWWQNKCLIAFY